MYAEFDLEIPASLSELFGVLARAGTARPAMLAGGTVTLVDIRARKEHPALVVSLDRLPELRGIGSGGDFVSIGARSTVTDILSSALLAEAAPSLVEASRVFAGQMVRNAATIGGNVACGSPAADLVPPLLSLDAELELASASGTRRVALADYYTGYKTDVCRPGEIIARILLPRPSPPKGCNRFYKLARRRGDAITIVGAAVTAVLEGGVCSMARIGLASVAPVPMRARQAEALLEGRAPTSELIARAAEAAMQECAPIDDIRASASYRRRMVGVLSRRLLDEAFGQLQ